MVDLKKRVDELSEQTNHDEIVRMLQNIGVKLINEYAIQVGGLTIEPLLVEAYYYHKGRFEDISVHASKESNANTYELARQRQANHFGELYIHYGCKDGFDIVLSQGEYYLSFLVKNALVNGEWTKQCTASEKICEHCENCNECQKGKFCKHYGKVVLKPAEHKKQWDIVFCKRKGLDNDFADKELAALPIDEIRNRNYYFTPGVSCTEIICKYIKSKLENKENLSRDELSKLKVLASGLISWKKFEVD